MGDEDGKKRGRPPKLDLKDLEDAIRASKGIVNVIAQKLGVNRQTIINYLGKYPKLKTMVEQERESFVDLAELKLLKLVNDENERAIMFVLETFGKNRGWTKRTEMTGADGNEIVVKVVYE